MAITKPKGLPKTGGRQKGTPNKTTDEFKQLLLTDGTLELSILRFKEILDDTNRNVTPETQLRAIIAFWDRVFGRPAQPVEGTENGPAIKQALQVMFKNANSKD